MPRMLLVDDEESVLKILSTLFKTKGFETATASDGGDAMEVLAKEKFDIMLTDVRMRPMDGLALLKFAHTEHPDLPVIMLTAYASVESAIEALKYGAFDYITKPFDIGQLMSTVERALDSRKGFTRRVEAAAREDISFYLDDIIAESPSMQDICNKVRKIAPTDTVVTIIGETGCSKGMIARALHNNSKRKDRPFHSLNCAVIPEPLLEAELLGYDKGAGPVPDAEKKGIFELVRGGTLYLEEVACMPQRLQDLLLEILRDKKVCRLGSTNPVTVSTRIIASSHSELEDAVKLGLFRDDLFYRLNVMSLRVKPLRERHEDIVPLFALMLGRALDKGAAAPDVPPETQAVLRSYAWSGNAEEMENAAAYAVKNLKNNAVTRESLPQRIAETPVDPAAMQGDPVHAKALKAFLLARGATDALAAAEASGRKAQENTAP